MCDKRKIKKEVLHHVSKSPCVSANNPPSSAYKNSRPYTQGLLLLKICIYIGIGV